MKLTEKSLDKKAAHFLTGLNTKKSFIRNQFFSGMRINCYTMNDACEIIIATLIENFEYHEDVDREKVLSFLGEQKFVSLFSFLTEEVAKTLKISIKTDTIEEKMREYVANDFIYFDDELLTDYEPLPDNLEPLLKKMEEDEAEFLREMEEERELMELADEDGAPSTDDDDEEVDIPDFEPQDF